MVLDSGAFCVDLIKVKGPNVKKNEMESSVSASKSPPQSTSIDLNSASVQSTPETNTESALTPKNTKGSVSNKTIKTDITPQNAIKTESTRFQCASWSNNGISDSESAVLKPKNVEIGTTFMTSEPMEPNLFTNIDSGLASVPKGKVETAVETPRDTLGSTLTNKKASELPSMPQTNMEPAASMPHFTKDYDRTHISATQPALVDEKALDLPLISPKTTASLLQVTSEGFNSTNKIVTATTSMNENTMKSYPAPKNASESNILIPNNDISSAKNTMGLVLTSHDKLAAPLSPKNTIEYKSMSNNRTVSTPQSNMEAAASLPQNRSTDRNSIKTMPLNDMDLIAVDLALLNQNTTSHDSIPKTTSSEPETFTKSVSVEKKDKYPTADQIFIGSTNNTALVNSTGSTVIQQFQSMPQTNMESAASVPQQTQKCTNPASKLSSMDKTPMESSLLSQNGVKSSLTPLNLELGLTSLPQSNMEASAKTNVEPLSESKTSTDSPSVDRMDRMPIRNPIDSPPTPKNKMEASVSGPKTTKEHLSKSKTITKSPSVDKNLERTSVSRTPVKKGIESRSEAASMPQTHMESGASMSRTCNKSPSKPKTITKSPSIDKMLSRKPSELPLLPQNKMAAAASLPKTLTKSPSVDKMDKTSLKKTSRDASKKEKTSLSDAAPAPTPPERRPSLKPPWRGGSCSPWPPSRSLTSPSLGPSGFIRRSESSVSVNAGLRGRTGLIRAATSLPHIPKAPSGRPCLLVALRPTNLQQQRDAFFQAQFEYEPQFEYEEPEPRAVLDKYREGSGLFLQQAVGIMECVLKKFGSYENFEEATGGSVLPKSQVWAAVRKYLQKEGCVGEVVVRLSEELLSQAVMVVENCRPTLTINLSGARQHWLEGMLRHEIGTHYLRGVNNSLQPWASSESRRQLGLKPANPTEEGLASLHSVLLRKQPFLWRAALLYYTVYHASSMSFSQLFKHIGRFVHSPDVRWEYCLRAKRGQTDTSRPGCFSKDQVYLDGILRILRHRRSIDFQLLTALGKVSFEDVERLRSLAVLSRTRIPHFLRDPERYLSHLDHIVAVNQLDDAELEQLLP